jgi:hypothetical protein
MRRGRGERTKIVFVGAPSLDGPKFGMVFVYHGPSHHIPLMVLLSFGWVL